MVLELLDTAQADQPELVGPREPVDLVTVTRSIAQRYEGEHHTFIVEAPEQVVGRYDARRIEQLLEHLPENAVTYSPQGGTVTLRLWQDEGIAHLTVADQCIGIPTGDLPYLFDRFHRGANIDDRRFPGWGLGLSICRRIVEQHGGQISVSSREGEGSTFHVTLPTALVGEDFYVSPHPDR
jgi:two-component system sensor histidine kinase VicK